MTFKQQTVLFHQPIDALGVDWGLTGGLPLALEERGDPPVPVGWSLVDKAVDGADLEKLGLPYRRAGGGGSRGEAHRLLCRVVGTDAPV